MTDVTDVTELRNWLIDNVSYNEETGICYWLTSKWNKSRSKGHDIGDVVGYTSHGYLVISINLGSGHKAYQLHQMIWLMKTGQFCSNTIDHINRIRSDNRWCNLREATAAENGQNKSMVSANKTGHIGVSVAHYIKGQPYYRADIGANRNKEYYYSYSLEECIEWRRMKVKEQHKEFGYLPTVD